MSENVVDRLEIQVQTQAQKANTELDKMAGKLRGVASALQSVNDSGKVQGIANGVSKLGQAMQSMSGVKTTDFSRLARNIEKLGNIDQSKINATASAIRTIANSLTASTGLTAGATQITDLANSISRLGYKSASNAITNIPLMAKALQDLMRTLSTSPQVSRNLIDMTNAISNLASQGAKVGSATNNIGRSLKGYSGHVKSATATTKAFTFSIAGLLAKIYAIKRAVTGLWGSVEKSMDFTETINLFQTSFKKIGIDTAEDLGLEMGSAASEQFGKAFIDRATNFNRRITDALSLDPNLMMNYQAVFAQMSNSMNLTAESAINISESFTLLGNDIASLWNIDTDNAMKKLQSGLAGQIRPLRELGVDISKTSLEMYALKYGITDSVEKMSQAAKVQLRWLAIMEQTEVAFGDMAKTIDSPANQLRVLQQQWTNLSRSIGNVFLPVVTTVLPYINAVVIALRRMIDTFATAVGFELPDYSDTNIYKDITTDIEGIGGEAEDATEFVDGLKKSLAGFDELNILSEGSGKKGLNLDLGGGYGELDDAIQQKTNSYMAKFNEELANMKNKAEELADKIQPKLMKFVEWMDKISPVLKGIGTAFVTYKVVTWFGSLASSLSALNPTTGVAFLAIGAIVAIYEAVKKYNKKLVEEDLADRFGKISLSLKEIDDIATTLTTSKYTTNIDVYVTEKQKLDEIEKDIKADLETLNKLNWKVSVGLGLTPEEQESYKSTIESFISKTETYMEQQQYVVSLAIDAVIQSDAEFNTEISNLVDEYFNASKLEMSRLGTQLRQEMDKALADGVLDSKEKEVIGNLIDEINQITSAVADAEFKATLQMITVDGKLSADSFKDLTKKIQETIDQRLESEEEAKFTALTYINIAYEAKLDEASSAAEKAKLQSEWDEAVKQLGVEFSQTKATITMEGMEFSLGTLNTAYATALENTREGLNQDTKDVLSEEIINNIAELGKDPEYAPYAMGEFATALYEAYGSALATSGLDTASKTGLQTMLDALAPTTDQYQKIYDDALAAGTNIPDGVSDALTDTMTLKALTGDMDAIYFLIGQKLSTDRAFLDLLATSKTAGESLPKGMIKGLKSKIPDLQLSAGNLVSKSGYAINNKITERKIKHEWYGKQIISQFKSSFDNDGTLVLSVKGWLDKIGSEISNYRLPSLSTNLLLSISGTDISDPLGIIPDKYKPKGYTTGGFPNTGEAFIARENGIPEMVGRIGNRTAVANNDQITDGIASAVEGALINVLVPMISTFDGTNSNTTVEVPLYLNGEELARGVYKGMQKYERRMQTVRVY